MSELILYHGSVVEVSKPNKAKGKPYNDYGMGFYCTEDALLASRWACRYGEDGIVSKYVIDQSNLNILILNEEFHILNWMAILCDNREFTNVTANRNADYIKKMFLIDYKQYDVIIGYRADDAYYRFVREYLTGIVGINTIKKAMYLGKQGLQVFIQSEKAFSQLKFIESVRVDALKHYTENTATIQNAIIDYDLLKEKNEVNDIFIRDIKGDDFDENSIPKIRIK